MWSPLVQEHLDSMNSMTLLQVNKKEKTCMRLTNRVYGIQCTCLNTVDQKF